MKSRLHLLIAKIISRDDLHAKWLNTLSYLENCGARQIAACEHPTRVKEEMLKHAAEEFRHAHYLKRQIKKVSKAPFDHYSLPLLLGGISTLHYLKGLDLLASRFLKQSIGLPKGEVKKMAYLLITYAIELRARKIYPLYHEILRTSCAKVFVKSIILEEEEHLAEIEKELEKLPLAFTYAETICALEKEQFNKWIRAIEYELKRDGSSLSPLS